MGARRVSAAGYYAVQGQLRNTDHNAVAAWIDKYCREQPLNKLNAAAQSLVGELAGIK